MIVNKHVCIRIYFGHSEHLGKWKSNSPILSIWNGIGVASHVGTAVVSYTVVSDNQSPWTTHTDVRITL